MATASKTAMNSPAKKAPPVKTASASKPVKGQVPPALAAYMAKKKKGAK